jgi:hypothetical protein
MSWRPGAAAASGQDVSHEELGVARTGRASRASASQMTARESAVDESGRYARLARRP